jgi:hypothetical protein
VAAIVDLCAELLRPIPNLRHAVVPMLDPDLLFGAGQPEAQPEGSFLLPFVEKAQEASLALKA